MSVLIIGSGISGLGAAKALSKLNCNYKIIDSYEEKDMIQFDIKKYDLLIISPAVSLEDKIVRLAKEKRIPVISEIEFGSYLDNGQIIGITGTNGKTTTSKILHSIMQIEKKVLLAGNIGISYADSVLEIKHDTTILELSSFQLESVLNFRPNIAAITNITQDHFNRHHNIENYIKAKLNIIKNQRSSDHLVLNSAIPIQVFKNVHICSQVWYISSKEKVKGAYCINDEIFFCEEFICKKNIIHLVGEHNLENILIAVCIAKICGIKNESIRTAISTIKNERHRIEYVATIKGKKYYNDSKGTNIDATISAIKCMEGDTCLIVGGSDKGYEFDELIKQMPSTVKTIFAIGEIKNKIREASIRNNFSRAKVFNSLEEAVITASKEKVKNILLSPATASFDMFKDYKERGNKFVSIVHKLITEDYL